MEKSEILGMIRERLEGNIRELNNSLDSQRTGSDIDEADTRDPEDFSQQSESRDKEMALQIQLDAARFQLSKFEDYSGKKISAAETGALVETDKSWFYMGISFSPLKVEGKELFGVSPDSPAYNSIKGKSKGDTFTVGKFDHTILDII